MKKTRVMIVSDVHLCHTDWYGVPTVDRMECLVRHLNDDCKNKPAIRTGQYSYSKENPLMHFYGKCRVKSEEIK